MNKTIIININGIVFHIEEDAYEILRAYMTEVKMHFAGSPDSTEITTDIENRIAEMFTEILERDKRQVIFPSDVQAVTAQMGHVKDFDQESATGDNEEAFFTRENSAGPKKLFRDADDRLISGVCSGLAAYFDTQTLWIRLAFLLAFLGFGTGLFLYIILWIVMPVARTRAEKMAMRGEKPNLQNFKKNFDEEMEHLRDGVNRMTREARPFLYKVRDFLGELFTHIGRFLNSGGKIIIKAIALFFLAIFLFGLVIAVGSLVAVTGFWSGVETSFFPMNVLDPDFRNMLLTAAAFTAIIPVLALILFIIRIVFNARAINRTVSFTLLIVWIVSLSVTVFYAAKTASDFSNVAELDENIALVPKPLYVLEENSNVLSREDSLRYGLTGSEMRGRLRFDGLNRVGLPENLRITIERADGDQPLIVRTSSAMGRNYETALGRTRKIQYHIAQRDSVIGVDPGAILAKGELWRDQKVSLTLKLPLNSRIRINGDVERYMRNVDYWSCDDENGSRPHIFTMTTVGLTCRPDTVKN